MQEISLYSLLKFYASKWMTILIVTTVGVVIGFIYNTFIQTPMYKSNATLILISSADQTSASDTTLINNYLQLFKSRRVLDPVLANNNLNLSYDDLINSTDANNAKNTAVIDVTIATTDPITSKTLVEGAIASFKSQVKELYGKDNVKVVDNASFNNVPYNVNTLMQLALSTAVGFILSIIALFFVFDLTNSKTDGQKAVQEPTPTDTPVDTNIDNEASDLTNDSDITNSTPDDEITNQTSYEIEITSIEPTVNQDRIQWLRDLYSSVRRNKR